MTAYLQERLVINLSADSKQKSAPNTVPYTGATVLFDDSNQKSASKTVPYTGATGTNQISLVFFDDASTSAPYFDFSPMLEEIDQVLNFLKQQLEEDEDTNFTAEIYKVIAKGGLQSINRIISLVRTSQVKGLFVSKLLQSLGDVSHPHTHLARKNALESLLFDSSARVRDGACLGLSVMNDVSSLQSVTIAAERENISVLKKNLQSLILQLKHGKEASSFYTRSI